MILNKTITEQGDRVLQNGQRLAVSLVALHERHTRVIWHRGAGLLVAGFLVNGRGVVLAATTYTGGRHSRF